MKKALSSMLLLVTLCSISSAAGVYRKAIFLHHSVGGIIYGGSYDGTPTPTTVPLEAERYKNGVSMDHQYFPGPSDVNNNHWYRWQEIFSGTDSYGVTMNGLLQTYPVIVVKSCYYSTTFMSSVDSIEAYKTHYRAVVKAMAQHPANFFVIWTNYPAYYTGSNQALWSCRFSTWAKDTLARGKDLFGTFPKNVYVFDVFRKIADSNTGLLPLKYVVGFANGNSSDNHPSNAAVAIVAPALVQETFDVAIAYEATGIEANKSVVSAFNLEQNYPNPFNPSTLISFATTREGPVTLRVHDILGREIATLVNDNRRPGEHTEQFDGSRVASGVYVYVLKTPEGQLSRRMVLSK